MMELAVLCVLVVLALGVVDRVGGDRDAVRVVARERTRAVIARVFGASWIASVLALLAGVVLAPTQSANFVRTLTAQEEIVTDDQRNEVRPDQAPAGSLASRDRAERMKRAALERGPSEGTQTTGAGEEGLAEIHRTSNSKGS